MKRPIQAGEWQTDSVIDGFASSTIVLGEAEDGPLAATLVRKKSAEGTGRAVLYLHGFIDYFFQSHVADAFVTRGWDFYALDLRRHGRSLRSGQRPNYTTDVVDYDEEIEASIDMIRSNDPSVRIVLMGHSTGGLVASYYAYRGAQKAALHALVLNSPFFAFAVHSARRYLLPLAGALGALVPWMRDAQGISPHYGHSLRAEHKGEWEYDKRWKPMKGFPVYYGWVRAIRKVQAVVARGLGLELPILLLHSDRSMPAIGAWNDDFLNADIVLNVDDMERVGRKLGTNVTIVPIAGAVHDIFLSKPAVRDLAIDTTLDWLDREITVQPESLRESNRFVKFPHQE